MLYRELGKSGLSVSEIGFGCMSLQINSSENNSLINHAIDAGVNFFDTADIYQNGENEICLGKAVRHKRDKILIATKVGNKPKKDGSGLDWDASKAHIFSAVEKSLERLQTDYIDLYQLHGGTIDDNIDETIEAFEKLKQQGKIRFYGISSIRPNVIREYVKRSNIVSVMMQYSILDRRPEEACFELLEQRKIDVLARGSIAKGLLINKPVENYLGYDMADVSKAATAISLLSNERRNNVQTALRFVLKQNVIASAVVGIRTMQQMQEAIKTVNSPELGADEIEYLRKILEPGYYELHR
ncbi:MAG TPA: aldo/keto reductase [Puia sp.]|nr:aldo/keto reductase [Puia sp.]